MYLYNKTSVRKGMFLHPSNAANGALQAAEELVLAEHSVVWSKVCVGEKNLLYCRLTPPCGTIVYCSNTHVDMDFALLDTAYNKEELDSLIQKVCFYCNI